MQELYIQSDINSGLSFHNISLILLLFADDMVIFGDTQMDLQNSKHGEVTLLLTVNWIYIIISNVNLNMNHTLTLYVINL